MLLELTVTNFAIIDALRLRLGPHLDIFTGETGAGKSIIVDAISALAGQRLGADVVRAGSERASVEGVFDVSALLAAGPQEAPRDDNVNGEGKDAGDAMEGENETLAQTLAAIGALDEVASEGTLILTREIARTGRNVARVNQRAVSLATLQRLATTLIDLHGQGASLALLRPERHVYYLDRYAGADELRGQVAARVGEWRDVRRELDRLRSDERELERRVELLRYQTDEIEAATLRPGELEELEGERRRLVNAERLLELSATSYAALAGDDTGENSGALDLLGAAQRALGELLRLDGTLDEQRETLEQALALTQDVAAALRDYQDEIAADPERQAEVEERLDLIARLRRKYGATIEDILAFGEQAARDLDELTHREEHAGELQAREEALRREIGALAARLSRQRQAAAQRLSAAMERELDDLNMRRARFMVQIEQTPDPAGAPVTLAGAFPASGEAAGDGAQALPITAAPTNGKGSTAKTTRKASAPVQVTQAPATAAEETERAAASAYAFTATGIDRVEFLIAPNPGEPFKPLARIASGGETSRLMLALKTILSRADPTPILIFDEIDAGISGRSGQVVGEKLWQLGQTHQVLCVTHLPQIAALGDTHYRVAKALVGDRTETRVEQLAEGQRVAEVGQMLGGADSLAARANAEELLARARAWKGEAELSYHAS